MAQNTYQDLWRVVMQQTLPVIAPVDNSDTTETAITNAGLQRGLVSNAKNLNELMVYRNPKPTDFINVVRDFPWTKSPKTSRSAVPNVMIVEKRIVTNSVVSNFASSLFTAKDISQTNLPTQVIEFFSQGAVQGAQLLSSLANTSINTTTGLGIAETAQKIINAASSAKDVVTRSSLNSSVLAPYDYLYTTEYTGFKYILPYFDNTYDTHGNAFGNDSQGIVGNLVNRISNIVEMFAFATDFLKPGVYIERSKQFSFNERGKTIKVSFPLLNTIQQVDISKNWQFLFGLIYQNKPGRVSRTVMDLPVIYEVNVPGNNYMPYAYISNLSINFLGTRRMMDVRLPKGFGVPSINTIVPDAYQVELEITSLVGDSRNFMFASVNRNPVTVPSAPPELLAAPTDATQPYQGGVQIPRFSPSVTTPSP